MAASCLHHLPVRASSSALLAALLSASIAAPVGGQIVISEFMAANVATHVDPESGEYSDWIELHNPDATEVELRGFTLSDGADSGDAWTIPWCRIPPGGYRLFWADGMDLPASDLPPPPESDLAVTGPGAAPGWQVETSSRTVATASSYEGRDALAVETSLLTLTFRAPDPIDLTGYRALALAIHPGEATAGSPGSFSVSLSGNFIDTARLLGDETNAPALDMAQLSWQEIEIPLEVFGPTQPLTRITIGGSLKGRFYLASVRLVPASFGYHTSFKLNQAGEGIWLRDPAGTLVDSLTFGPQIADISAGRSGGAGGPLLYYADPTPGRPNGVVDLAEPLQTSLPEFSLDGGPYAAGQTLVIRHPDPQATIHYSLDGSRPGQGSPQYTAPLALEQTTAVRARAYTPAHLPSDIVSATYVISLQTTLPVVAITTDPAHLWDEQIGIYVEGTNGIIADDSIVPMNSNQPWERPAYLEFYETDGTAAIHQQIGLSIYGAFSRHFTQKSLSIIARDKFGADEIPYPVFSDRPTQVYKSFILRNGGNDWLTNMLDDALMQAMVAGRMNVDYQAYRPVVVLLNGHYWGLHNAREKLNRYYLADNHGVDPDAVDIIEANGIVKAGTADAFRAMMDFMDSQQLDTPEAFAEASRLIDADSYADLQIALIYAAPADNFFKNVKCWRAHTAESRWRWFLYDTDNGYGNPDQNAFRMATDPNAENRFGDISWGTLVLRRLLENDPFRDEFIQRFAAHLNSTFAPDRVTPILDSLAATIAPEIAAHSARWRSDCLEHRLWGTFCGISSEQSWRDQVERLGEFVRLRPARLRAHIREHFGLGPMAELRVETEGNGHVLVNGVADAGNGPYYSAVPLRLQAVAAPGYRLAEWRGDVSGTIPELELTVADTTRIVARFAAIAADPALTGLRINEICASNDTSLADEMGEFDDWIEVHNTGSQPLDIGGLYVTDRFDRPLQWRIPTRAPDSTTIAPGGFLVLWADRDVDQGILHMDLRLDADGEQLALVQLLGMEPVFVDSFGFGAQLPDVTWGRYPDGADAMQALSAPSPGRANEPFMTAVTADARAAALPREFALQPNYPNPFNSRTTIVYDLPAPSWVRLRVYSIAGQLVASLVRGRQEAGRHRLVWDSRGALASGVYVCRLETDGFTASRRMLLLE